MDYSEADKLFRGDGLNELASTEVGLRFLKLRSLSRKAHLQELFERVGVSQGSGRVKDMLVAAFEDPIFEVGSIEATISAIYRRERTTREIAEPELVDHLYRMNVFDWGGLHENSLERTIVNNYVKKIRDYDELSDCIDNEIHQSMRGYVLCSWYNHWTSIIIEDIFRDHDRVLPSVGLVNKIDFFLDDVPFDLKVTYLPEGYVKDLRKGAGLRPELTLLKQWARKFGVVFSTDQPASRLLPDLWNKAADHPSNVSRVLIDELFSFRTETTGMITKEPTGLIRWLYENQGVRRFDASNRLFLILIDSSNYFESWRLKRARPLLGEEITKYLNGMPNNPGREVEFGWDGDRYVANSDAIIVLKP